MIDILKHFKSLRYWLTVDNLIIPMWLTGEVLKNSYDKVEGYKTLIQYRKLQIRRICRTK